jgi:hypothetical protein
MMAFDQDTKVKALAACARYCCICHRFSGLKIELHHINLKSEGGDDTFENCIPLCFDCHADMRSYDHNHPKGTKYSPKEIILHRDNWYSRIANPNFSDYDDDSRISDVKIFNKLIDDVPIKSIKFISDHHFSQSFHRISVESLFYYADRLESAFDEFLDPELENARVSFRYSMVEFTEKLSVNTWALSADASLISVPTEWKYTQIARFDSITKEINKLSCVTVGLYNDLIRLARRKLKI